MKRPVTSTLLASVCLLGFGTRPAWAYYDEVHYALTYYVARQRGYTPEQAYRIASACEAIDWPPAPTEPVQLARSVCEPWTLGLVNPQQARWKFHAFRDGRRFAYMVPELDPRGSSYRLRRVAPVGQQGRWQEAENAIKAQRVRLWTAALENKNLGVFLHFLQDEPPHHGYGTQAGHQAYLYNPSSRELQNQGLPQGGTTDWLAFTESNSPGSAAKLANDTASSLRTFMRRVSPHQWKYWHSRSPGSGALDSVVAALCKANEDYPAPIPPELGRTFIWWKLGWSWGAQVDAWFEKHVNGPDDEKVHKVINEALSDAGMGQMVERDGHWVLNKEETLPREYRRYSFDDEGEPTRRLRDSWVITGTLEVVVNDKAGSRATWPQGAEVIVKAVPTRASVSQPYELARQTANRPGTHLNFTDMPIGDLLVEVQVDGRKLEEKRVRLDQASQTETFTLEIKPDSVRYKLVYVYSSRREWAGSDYKMTYEEVVPTSPLVWKPAATPEGATIETRFEFPVQIEFTQRNMAAVVGLKSKITFKVISEAKQTRPNDALRNEDYYYVKLDHHLGLPSPPANPANFFFGHKGMFRKDPDYSAYGYTAFDLRRNNQTFGWTGTSSTFLATAQQDLFKELGFSGRYVATDYPVNIGRFEAEIGTGPVTHTMETQITLPAGSGIFQTAPAVLEGYVGSYTGAELASGKQMQLQKVYQGNSDSDAAFQVSLGSGLHTETNSGLTLVYEKVP